MLSVLLLLILILNYVFYLFDYNLHLFYSLLLTLYRKVEETLITTITMILTLIDHIRFRTQKIEAFLGGFLDAKSRLIPMDKYKGDIAT